MPDRTPAECLEELKGLKAWHGEEAHGQLRALIRVATRSNPASIAFLDVLEALRAPLDRVQAIRARHYTRKLSEPGDLADGALREVCETWQELANAYAYLGRDTNVGASASIHALIAQRQVHYTARVLIEYLSARRAVPGGMWAALHSSFCEAEARGFAYTRADDPLNRAWQAQSAAEAHVVALLIDLSNPFSHPHEEFETIRELAEYFAPYCRLLPEDSDAENGRRAAYALDLLADRSLRPVPTLPSLSGLRRLDSGELADRFRTVATRLRKGGQPAELGVSGSATSEDVVQILLALYRPWARGSSGRRFSRRQGGGGAVELTGDWKGIAFYISGKTFAQPTLNNTTRSVSSDMRMLTLGERVTDIVIDDRNDIQRAAERRGYFCTQWDILDESLGGFRLRRRSSSDRVEHRELIALRPQDAKSFMLGTVSWVMYREDGALEAGVKLLNGMPRVVAIRSVGVGMAKDRPDLEFQQAFFLSETPAIKTPATLVIPAGYFLPFRIVEVFDGSLRGYRLLEVVTRGSNFDQVSFESVKIA